MGSNQESDPFADLLGLGDLKEKSKSPRRQSMASQSSKGGLLAGVGATSSGDWMLFESDAAGGSSTPHGAIRPSDLDLSASPSFGSDATFSPQASAGMGPSSANWVSFDSPGERKTNVGGGRASSDNDLADFASFSSEPAYGEAAATSLPARQDSEPPSYFEVTQQAGVPVLQHVAGKRFESLDSMGPAQSSGSATWSPWQLPGESSEDGRNSVPKHAALGSSKSLLQETESFRSMMKKAWMATPPAFCNLRLPPIRSSPSTSYVSCMAILGNELVVGVCKEVRTWRLDAVGKELSEIESESEKYEVLSTPDEWHQSKRPTAMFAEPFRLWCGFDDGTVVLWHKNDSDQWKVEYAFNATRSAVTALAVVGHYLWTGSESGNVCLWKLKEIDRMRQGLDFTTDLGQSVKQFCRRLSTPVTSGAASTKPHSSVQWMLQSNKLIYSFGAHVMVVWDQHGNFRGRLNCVDSEGVRYENWAEDDHGAPSNVRRGKQGFLRKIVGKSHLMLRTRNMVKAGAANVLATVGRTMAAAADYATASGTGSESGVAFKRARVTSTCSGADNSVWVGYSDGWLRLWNSGICVAKLRLGRKALRAICPVRKYLWIGSKLGLIFIVEVDVPNEDDENGSVNLRCISCWRAHQYSLLHIVSGRAQVVTCDTLGNIKSWPRTAPIERDNTIEIELQRSKPHFTSACDITVFATTWNVNESKPSDETIAEWLRGDVEASDVVVIGLQEIETGGGAVVGQAVKNVTGNVRDKLMKPSATGSWWIATLNRHLTGLRGVRQFDSFCLAGSKQLAGILLCVWVRNSIKDHTSEPTSAVVTCGGPGRSLANKGVVGISLCIHRQRLTFLNSHLAAHQNAVEARNEDYHHILSNIHFYSQSHLDVQEYSSELMATDTDKSFRNHKKISDDHSLVDSDLVVWIGDLNYRIDAPYENVLGEIQQKNWQVLWNCDQLLAQKKDNKAFDPFEEAPLKFPPSYKFDKGTSRYDTSEKQRVPAWCDRVLFAHKKGLTQYLPSYTRNYEDSDEENEDENDGVTADDLAALKVEDRAQGAAVESVLEYTSLQDVMDSDHKPVKAVLSVRLEVVDEHKRRNKYSSIVVRQGLALEDAGFGEHIDGLQSLHIQSMPAAVGSRLRFSPSFQDSEYIEEDEFEQPETPPAFGDLLSFNDVPSSLGRTISG